MMKLQEQLVLWRQVCWGSGSYGKTGQGSTTTYGTNNDILTATSINFNGTLMTAVEASQDHSCSISSAGEVYCWGEDSWPPRLWESKLP